MTAMTPDFRLATPADAAELGRFMTRNFLSTYGHCSTPENVQACVEEHYCESAQQRQIGDPSRWNLVMTVGGQWAGHAQLLEPAEPPANVETLPTIELSRCYVDTAWHGRSLAHQMMEQAKHEARRRGARSLTLSVWQEQPQAIRFYTKEGFRIIGTRIFMVGPDPKDDWLMVCDLA